VRVLEADVPAVCTLDLLAFIRAHCLSLQPLCCRWTQIRVRPAPSGRFGHSLDVCGGGRLLLMHGGCLDTAGFLALTHAFVQCSETWVLDLASFRSATAAPLHVCATCVCTCVHKHVSGEPFCLCRGAPGVAWLLHDAPMSLFVFCVLCRSWQKVSSSEGGAAGAAAGHVPVTASPSERMCHTMCALSDGRLLLLGGRNKEGICTVRSTSPDVKMSLLEPVVAVR
jgi:host cell factor